MVDAPLTIRDRSTARLFGYLSLMKKPEDDSDLWQHCLLGDIDDISNSTAPVVGMDQGIEQLVEQYGGASWYNLSLFFSFRWQYEEGVDNILRYQYYLGLLQKALLGNHTLSTGPNDLGLTLDIKEESNTPHFVGQRDPTPGGVLTVIMKYRTATHDPYKLPGE